MGGAEGEAGGDAGPPVGGGGEGRLVSSVNGRTISANDNPFCRHTRCIFVRVSISALFNCSGSGCP